jgi:hypothetical protein
VTALVAADNVELAVPGARIPRDDAHAAALQLARGGGFAEIAEDAAGIGHLLIRDLVFGLPRR